MPLELLFKIVSAVDYPSYPACRSGLICAGIEWFGPDRVSPRRHGEQRLPTQSVDNFVLGNKLLLFAYHKPLLARRSERLRGEGGYDARGIRCSGGRVSRKVVAAGVSPAICLQRPLPLADTFGLALRVGGSAFRSYGLADNR
jgi:hypothetical protein